MVRLLKYRRILIGVSFLTAMGASFLVSSRLLAGKTKTDKNPETSLTQNISPVTEIPVADIKELGILILGYGGAGHEGSYLTDVMMLIDVDFEKSQMAMISIPRDLWVKFPDGVERKINAAFSLGAGASNLAREEIGKEPAQTGGEAVKTIVSGITGLPVHQFVAIDFVGFQRAIGAIGGVEIEASETLDDSWYPVTGRELETCGLSGEEVGELSAKYSGFELEKQFPCRYEHLLFEKGEIHLEGGEALKYVRSRHGSGGGDFSRSQRQQELLVGLRKKLISVGALDDSVKFFSELVEHVRTDVDEGMVKYLTPALANIGQFEVKKINLSTGNVLGASKSSGGAFALVPKAGSGEWASVAEFISRELRK